MNIDDLAVLRLKNTLTDFEKASYIIRALKQIGKDYDFNFDVETQTKLICSELVYLVYEDFDWEIDKTLGRYTISPMHVAKEAISPGPFELKTLYHRGKLIDQRAKDLFKSFIIKQKKKRSRRRYLNRPTTLGIVSKENQVSMQKGPRFFVIIGMSFRAATF